MCKSSEIHMIKTYPEYLKGDDNSKSQQDTLWTHLPRNCETMRESSLIPLDFPISPPGS